MKNKILEEIKEKFFEYNLPQVALKSFTIGKETCTNPILCKKNGELYLKADYLNDYSIYMGYLVLMDIKILEEINKNL